MKTALEYVEERIRTHRYATSTIEIAEMIQEYADEQSKDQLLKFQIYLSNRKLITGYDWEYERIITQFLRWQAK